MYNGADVKINAEFKTSDFFRDFARLQHKQLPYATMLALNTIAFSVQAGEKALMLRELDKPKAYTLNSLRIQSAKKANLSARVFFRGKPGGKKSDSPDEYLQHHVNTRTRRHKGIEGLLAARGLLDRGAYVVPAKGAKLDAYGNVSRAQIRKVVEGVTTRSKSDKYFAIKNGPEAGIWQRTNGGKSIKPVFRFQSHAPVYRARFAFYKAGENIVKARYVDAMRFGISEAIRTAR